MTHFYTSQLSQLSIRIRIFPLLSHHHPSPLNSRWSDSISRKLSTISNLETSIRLTSQSVGSRKTTAAFSQTCRATFPRSRHLFSSSRMENSEPTVTEKPIHFPVTPYPDFSQDPGSKVVRKAAILVIGDEILNGKTLDTNSHHLASLLFSLGIHLCRIEVIPDDEEDIVKSMRRLCEKDDEFDMIFTSGGIGPTHDDITYQSLAKVFDPEGSMEYDQETLRRMKAINQRNPKMQLTNPEQIEARRRMALFPKLFTEVLFVLSHLWVPVVRIKQKIFILPGVPGLFTQLIEALLENYVHLPPQSEKPTRRLIQTPLPESSIAPFLSNLSKELRKQKDNIRIGSYPNLVTGSVTVSLIGTNSDKIDQVSDQINRHFETLSSSKM